MNQNTFFARAQSVAHTLLRVVAAFVLMEHGAMKLFGAFGAGQSVPLASLMGVAGIIEFFVAALVLLGLLTRPAAFLISGEMAVAYFMAHFPRGFWPIQNHGEPAVLNCFIFLFLAAAGAGPFSLDALIARKRAGAKGSGAPVAAGS